jgi:hypothetical protein
MKLKIFKNSLRFRLDNEDIKNLEKKSYIHQKIYFGNNKDQIFHYSIKCSYNDNIQVIYEINRILIILPNNSNKYILNKNNTLYKGSIKINTNILLDITIEKDLKSNSKYIKI